MEFDPATIEAYRLKLRYKVRYHVGGFCPDAEDIVQEALTRFLEAARDGRIRNPDSLGAFLSGICNNVISEYRRRLWREPPAEDPGPGQTVAPEAEWLELQDAVAAALAELSDRDGQILRAFFLQEKEKDEICRSLGISDNQFRVALFRAKERFRKIYLQGLKRKASGTH